MFAAKLFLIALALTQSSADSLDIEFNEALAILGAETRNATGPAIQTLNDLFVSVYSSASYYYRTWMLKEIDNIRRVAGYDLEDMEKEAGGDFPQCVHPAKRSIEDEIKSTLVPVGKCVHSTVTLIKDKVDSGKTEIELMEIALDHIYIDFTLCLQDDDCRRRMIEEIKADIGSVGKVVAKIEKKTIEEAYSVLPGFEKWCIRENRDELAVKVEGVLGEAYKCIHN